MYVALRLGLGGLNRTEAEGFGEGDKRWTGCLKPYGQLSRLPSLVKYTPKEADVETRTLGRSYI